MMAATDRRIFARIRMVAGRALMMVAVIVLSWDFARARDWFVRPAGGSYGRENGRTYTNAWNGLHRIVWGRGGVQPGDTLYVCGLHVHNAVKRVPIVTQADIPIVSGAAEDARIVIRGDWPGDAGVVWGAYRMSYERWRPEGGGVWSITLPGDSFPDWFFQDIGTSGPLSHIVLDKAAGLEELRRHPGSHFSPDYRSGSRLYVHCSDGKSPEGRIYGNRYGYQFILGNSRYVTFRNLTFHGVYKLVHQDERPSYVRWEGCRLAYGEHSLIGFWGHTEGNEVVGCDLEWAANGIYTIRSPRDGDLASNNYVFRGNRIRTMGVRPSTWDRDAHAIGIQGGANGIIEDNVIEDCGSGPLLYAFRGQPLTNTMVRRNLIRNLHTLGGASGYGISTQCDNDSLSDKSGNVFSNNVVVNARVGFRMQFEDEQTLIHNAAVDCDVGLESTRNFNGTGARILLRNTIFHGSRRYHIRWASGATDMMIDSDYNCFYPATGMMFNFRGKESDLSGWRRISSQRVGVRLDRHSITGMPLFGNPSGAFQDWRDFLPAPGSPMIGSGNMLNRSGTVNSSSSDIGPVEFELH